MTQRSGDGTMTKVIWARVGPNGVLTLTVPFDKADANKPVRVTVQTMEEASPLRIVRRGCVSLSRQQGPSPIQRSSARPRANMRIGTHCREVSARHEHVRAFLAAGIELTRRRSLGGSQSLIERFRN